MAGSREGWRSDAWELVRGRRERKRFGLGTAPDNAGRLEPSLPVNHVGSPGIEATMDGRGLLRAAH